MVRNVTALLACFAGTAAGHDPEPVPDPALTPCHLTFVRRRRRRACRQLRPFQDRRSGFFLTWTA